jgi:hypothetical protein
MIARSSLRGGDVLARPGDPDGPHSRQDCTGRYAVIAKARVSNAKIGKRRGFPASRQVGADDEILDAVDVPPAFTAI